MPKFFLFVFLLLYIYIYIYIQDVIKSNEREALIKKKFNLATCTQVSYLYNKRMMLRRLDKIQASQCQSEKKIMKLVMKLFSFRLFSETLANAIRFILTELCKIFTCSLN